MRIRVLGGGWYGCHLGLSLIKDGHEVELHEIADRLFAGASGANPARAHLGFHYPRSKLTRAACQENAAEFIGHYGFLTRGVPCNIYAIAAHESLMDFGTYCQVLRDEVAFVPVDRPEEYGLRDVEGAVLTGERHILVDKARKYFTVALGKHVTYGIGPGGDAAGWDFTIDCSFCARDAYGIDRYEPCVVGLLKGPTDRCLTIMDGPFPSVYVWDEDQGLSSLSSALYTPFSKGCRTYEEAKAILDGLKVGDAAARVGLMVHSLERFWPASRDLYEVAGHKLAIRAMPRSGADARLVDVIKVDAKTLRVRAGKIDAIFHAERIVREMMAA